MNEVVNNIKRGDIIFFRNEGMNGPILGNHPAVVIQNDVANYFNHNLIICVITSKQKRLDLKTHVVLKDYVKLRESMVMTEHVYTIKKDDVIAILEPIKTSDMIKVDEALKFSLGI